MSTWFTHVFYDVTRLSIRIVVTVVLWLARKMAARCNECRELTRRFLVLYWAVHLLSWVELRLNRLTNRWPLMEFVAGKKTDQMNYCLVRSVIIQCCCCCRCRCCLSLYLSGSFGFIKQCEPIVWPIPATTTTTATFSGKFISLVHLVCSSSSLPAKEE